MNLHTGKWASAARIASDLLMWFSAAAASSASSSSAVLPKVQRDESRAQGLDAYRIVTRILKTAQIPRHISPHSQRHAASTNALDAGLPLRDVQILARHATPAPPSTSRRTPCGGC